MNLGSAPVMGWIFMLLFLALVLAGLVMLVSGGLFMVGQLRRGVGFMTAISRVMAASTPLLTMALIHYAFSGVPAAADREPPAGDGAPDGGGTDGYDAGSFGCDHCAWDHPGFGHFGHFGDQGGWSSDGGCHGGLGDSGGCGDAAGF